MKSLYLARKPSTKIGYSSQSLSNVSTDEVNITFTCKASGYTDMRILQLRYEEDGNSMIYRAGCGQSPEDKKIWISISSPDISLISGIKRLIIDDKTCNPIGNPKGFTLIVRLNVTDSKLGGRFYCRAFEGRGGVGEVLSETVTLDKIKGKHFQATAVFYVVIL